MKNRRIITVSFLLVAVLLMGVAFAALTDNLFIKGEANLKTDVSQPEFDADVYFIKECTESGRKSDKVGGNGSSALPTTDEQETVTIGTSDNDSATFHIYTLGKQDEWVSFSFVIKNDSDEYDAVVKVDANYPSTTSPDMFKIEYSVDNSTWYTSADTIPTVTVPSEDCAIVYVRVTLLKSPSENTSSAFNVNLTATSATPAMPG